LIRIAFLAVCGCSHARFALPVTLGAHLIKGIELASTETSGVV
jgi:hypothetical protein